MKNAMKVMCLAIATAGFGTQYPVHAQESGPALSVAFTQISEAAKKEVKRIKEANPPTQMKRAALSNGSKAASWGQGVLEINPGTPKESRIEFNYPILGDSDYAKALGEGQTCDTYCWDACGKNGAGEWLCHHYCYKQCTKDGGQGDPRKKGLFALSAAESQELLAPLCQENPSLPKEVKLFVEFK